MAGYKLQILMSLVYLLQIPQGKCQTNDSKSGIVDNYDEINRATTQPGQDYSFYDTLDNKGRILFIAGTCVLGIILLTMLGCYIQTHSCKMSCGTNDAAAHIPPLVNVVTVNSQIRLGGSSEQATGQADIGKDQQVLVSAGSSLQVPTSRQPSPRPSPTVSRSIFVGLVPSSSQQDIAMQDFNTSQHLAPSHSLWRYHSTGRMQTAVPGSPGAGELTPNQALGNLPSRFCASAGHLPGYLYPGHPPLCYPPEKHLFQGNLSREPSLTIHQPYGVTVPHLPSFTQPLPAIEIQSPSPSPRKRVSRRSLMSRSHSEGYLAAGAGAAGQSRADIPPAALRTLPGQLWRSPSTGLLCPTYSQSGGSTECLTSPGPRVQPSAPPLDLL